MAEKELDPIRQRLKEYLFKKNVKMAQLEREAGLSIGYLRNGKGAIGTDKLALILEACPDLNGTWLITGLGPMLASDANHLPEGAKSENSLQAPGKVNRVIRPSAKNMFLDGNMYLTDEEAGFFATNNALILIESLDVDKVPEKHRGLVREIQQRKRDYDKAVADREAKQAQVDDLTAKLLSAHQQIMTLMSENQKLKEQK